MFRRPVKFDPTPSLLTQIKKAFHHPARILPFIRRVYRNRSLRTSSSNFLEFYARLQDDNVTRIGAGGAIGSYTRETWVEIGKFQFDFLVSHGLRPDHRFLDIGCGNLRLGTQLIPYLDTQMYVGIEISARIVGAALDVIRSNDLQQKLPYIFLVSETNYGFLPENHFDAVHAHSVFSHLPIDEVEKVMRQAFRVLKPGGWFDFTYFNRENNSAYLSENFCYPSSVILELAGRCGFQPQEAKDWVYLQEKIRATKPL
jgi:ubiquinone/menaquinone biosynthesis C-methylase UbiE